MSKINNIISVIKKIESDYLSMFKNIDFFSINAVTKDNLTSVTKYDLEATNFCIKYIKDYFPESNIWIEENQKILSENRNELTWIIDPLDGTASFTRGYPIWGIGIAVLFKNQPIYSCFIAPRANFNVHSFENTIFFNEIKINPMALTSISNIDTKTIFISSRLHKKINFSILKEYKLRNFGSTLYHLFMVALGKAESVLISSSYIWDLAAVFHLGNITNCKFYEYNSNIEISISKLLEIKNNKIDIILEYKKENLHEKK